MNSTAVRANRRRLMLLAVLALLCAAGYLLVNTDPGNARLFAYSMKIRAPKLAAMALTAVSIGGASIVFQTIINNTIVTPCLLGMNSLYTLIHTAVVFFLGSSSIVASNANLAFGVDVILMGITATLLYGWIFRKTKHNVLYVLLVGTVLTSFFGSIQTTLTRVMDPNEYDALLSGLVASFSNINSEILLFSALLLAGVAFALRRELARRLAILTQSNHIQMKLTVRELVAFGRFPHSGSRLTETDEAFVERAIAYMELEEFQDRFLDELSGGQRQRALIAMVIAQDTEYILLDEPTNNLDIYHATNLMKTVRRLCDELGKTVILVLHEINYAAFYSDYICAFKDGRIARFGPVEEVITSENLSAIYGVEFQIQTVKGKPLSIYY